MKTLRECALELEIEKLKFRIMELENKIPLHVDVVNNEKINVVAIQENTDTLRRVGTLRGFRNKNDFRFHCIGSTCSFDKDYQFSYYLDRMVIPSLPASMRVLMEMHLQMVKKICKDMEMSGINLI
jgi:hypothetical protein